MLPFRKAALMALALTAAPTALLAAPADAGKFTLDARLRYEDFQQDGPDAEALTVRARLGYQTPTVSGFSAFIEAEGVGALIDDYADGIDAKPGRAIITDPETLELNRAQVTWTGPQKKAEVTFGRQRIVLNNARFVGNSGWRQNEQTFDAIKLVGRPTKALALTYAYIDRVNRSVGHDSPQGVWKGDVHLLQADAATRVGALSTYGYLLDFNNAPAQSSATWGARLSGSKSLQSALAATWELEYARQGEWGNSPDNFDLSYVLVSGGLKTAKASGALVFERLDGDGHRGFQTPLASLHGFQGWSDVIGATPAAGLRDVYLRGGLALKPSRPVKLSAEAHDFRDADGGRRFGRELDLGASTPIGKRASLETGVALFDTASTAYRDGMRGWVSLEYKY